ncbi:type II toxin-antitoxin system VapC family toxin [Ciceribacter sp. L1K23]|uniref:type II toxin-antitoxin system VapC family toxin n=1 Tax=Ciceribacter sp. L1K23 TaxID=2820276 RepID=UPI001B829330|nr:type II toxin-antitoxin system VapC family toxin [Ciceribacter sp. L1K23]MBR0556300.1 type II toxin-antitoxin system VapC family toxin [Ciceribacter sp. L1K23]
MILADSSIWIDHLRSVDPGLQALLNSEQVIIHPFVIGELSLGHIPRYDQIMTMLADLPTIATAHDTEVRHLIRSKSLFGTGIGYVDAHLLASVNLVPEHQLWTRDKRLHRIATTLKVAAPVYLH